MKHELKLALIYLLGIKMKYDEIKKIWRGRLDFENNKFDKHLVEKGVVFGYFAYIAELLTKNLKDEKKSMIDFKSIDLQNKGFISYDEFK